MTIFVQLPISSYPAGLPLGFAQTTGFSYKTAQAMMWLAQLSYEHDDTIDTILAQWQLRVLAHLHSRDTRRVVGYGDAGLRLPGRWCDHHRVRRNRSRRRQDRADRW